MELFLEESCEFFDLIFCDNMDPWCFSASEIYFRFGIDFIAIELESWDGEVDSRCYISFLSDDTTCLIADISHDLNIDRPHLRDPID